MCEDAYLIEAWCSGTRMFGMKHNSLILTYIALVLKYVR